VSPKEKPLTTVSTKFFTG